MACCPVLPLRVSSQAKLSRECHSGCGLSSQTIVAGSPRGLVQLEDRIRGSQLPAKGASAKCLVAIANPQQNHATHYECVIEQRGRYRFGPLRLASGFPFGLINAWKNTRTHTTFTVYPRLAQLNPTWTSIIENRREGLAAAKNSSGPNEGEFFGIRGWQTGDSQRWIHWRTSARIGELAVRQFEQRNRTQLSVVLDPFCPPEDEQAAEHLEWAISVAAAMVVDVSSTATSRIAFAIADHETPALHMRRVREFSHVALSQLATVKPTTNINLERAIIEVLAYSNPTWPIVIVSPRASCLHRLGQNETEFNYGQSDEAELPLSILNRLDLVWLDVTQPSSHRIAQRPEVQRATH